MDFVLNTLKTSVAPYSEELAENPLNKNLKDFVKEYLFNGSTPFTRAIQEDPVLKGELLALINEQGEDLVLGHDDTFQMLNGEFSAWEKSNKDLKFSDIPKHLQELVSEGKIPMPTQLKPGDILKGYNNSNGEFVADITRADGSRIVKSNDGEKLKKKKKKKWAEPTGWSSYNFKEEWKTDRQVKVPYEVFEDERLNSTARLVLIALISYANHFKNGLCFPSREELSRTTGFSISALSRATEALVHLGWLTKYQPNKQSSAHYHLHIPKLLKT